MASIIGSIGPRRQARRVYFDRSELGLILSQYSLRVMRGEWRDYAIDHGAGRATFSIFRHTLETPLFQVVKTVKPNGEAEFTVFTGPRKLASGPSLPGVLAVFDRMPRVVRVQTG